MSTSYGLACPTHKATTDRFIAQQTLGRQTLAGMWDVRDVVAGMARLERFQVVGPKWFGIDDPEDAVLFIVQHRDCLGVEMVNEYGDRELIEDVIAEEHEPDADEVVRETLAERGFPADVIDRTCISIVDALDRRRILNAHRRPERLR
jgi:hypothetical protein